MRRLTFALCLFVPFLARPVVAADGLSFRMREIDPHVGNVCYALATTDVDGDGKPDIVAVTEDAVVWFENPTWKKHTIIKGQTEKDNVCLQPHDIDGDGRVDFALGAAWRPTDTKTGGTLQLLTRTGAKEGEWRIIPLLSEPTLHRIRWGNPTGEGPRRLIVAPLQGRDTKAADWSKGNGVRILVLTPPKGDPFAGKWTEEVASDSLHTTHNLQLIDFDQDGRDEILLAAWEGVFLLDREPNGKWTQTKLGTGNQDTKPFKGASEIKLGKLKNGGRYIATIEPWHGTQVVVYTPNKTGLWTRTVIDEPVQWGHAVWCADLDGDGDDELCIGQRDKAPESRRGLRGPGVYVYKHQGTGADFGRTVVDDGGVAVEDLIAVDLNADGKPDLVAGGRATHNVRIYWNQSTGR